MYLCPVALLAGFRREQWLFPLLSVQRLRAVPCSSSAGSLPTMPLSSVLWPACLRSLKPSSLLSQFSPTYYESAVVKCFRIIWETLYSQPLDYFERNLCLPLAEQSSTKSLDFPLSVWAWGVSLGQCSPRSTPVCSASVTVEGWPYRAIVSKGLKHPQILVSEGFRKQGMIYSSFYPAVRIEYQTLLWLVTS